jgi:ATP-binding cassette subfamily B protein
MARLYDPSTGKIKLDGIDLKHMNLQGLRQGIGFVPQDAFLFSDSIENNIRFGQEEANSAELEMAATNAGIHQNILEFKNGYQTLLGERGLTVSGGQKQRISIARALIKDPEILIFDDCLSAVDTETEETILKNLNKICDGKTTFIVSHRISSVKYVDRIIVLDQGEIIQEGTHEKLIEKQGYYRDFYQQQLLEKEPESLL